MENRTPDTQPIGTTQAREVDEPIGTSKTSAAAGKARNLASQATEKARDTAEEQKSRATGELGAIASALHQAGDQLGADHQSSRFIHMAADKLDQVSRTIEGRDMDTLMRDARSFARRNPAVFVGGAIALGFVASRFLKASADEISYDPYGAGAAGFDTTAGSYDTFGDRTPGSTIDRGDGRATGLGGTDTTAAGGRYGV